MNNVIAITSGKGGVGKSTVAAGLACAAARGGKTVLLVDLDQGLRCLDLMLGVSETVAFDLADVLSGRDAESALYPVDGVPGLYLLPAPDRYDSIDPALFGSFARQAAEQFDLLIVDFPAGIDLSLYHTLPDFSLFLTVCTPDPVSMRDGWRMGQALGEIGKEHIRLVINRYSYGYIKEGLYAGIDDMIDASALQLAGIIPEDKRLACSLAAGEPVTKGKAYAAFARMARRLNGETVPLPHPKKI